MIKITLEFEGDQSKFDRAVEFDGYDEENGVTERTDQFYLEDTLRWLVDFNGKGTVTGHNGIRIKLEEND